MSKQCEWSYYDVDQPNRNVLVNGDISMPMLKSQTKNVSETMASTGPCLSCGDAEQPNRNMCQ